MVSANRQKIIVQQAPAMATGMFFDRSASGRGCRFFEDGCVAGAEFNRFPSQDIRCFAGQ